MFNLSKKNFKTTIRKGFIAKNNNNNFIRL